MEWKSEVPKTLSLENGSYQKLGYSHLLFNKNLETSTFSLLFSCIRYNIHPYQRTTNTNNKETSTHKQIERKDGIILCVGLVL